MIDDITVDEREMKTFDALSIDWWTPKTAHLHKANRFLFNYVTEIISKNFPKDVQVLDVGCGGGYFSEPLAQHGFNVVGIDVNLNVIKVAQKHAQESSSLSNLTYKHESMATHSVNHPEKYDVVILHFVLQHSNNHDVLLSNTIKALKPGGLLFLTSAAKTYRSWMSVVIMSELIYRCIPRHGHNWHNFISANEVEAILNKNQCVVRETKGLYYNPLWKDWNWNSDVDGGFYSMYANKK